MNAQNQERAFMFARGMLPNEACGLVIIERGHERFIPCRNISPFPRDTFELDPEDYARAEERGEIVEIFHSHCYGSPQPSEADKVACEATNLPWSIVSVPNGQWVRFEPNGYKAPLIGREWAHGLLDCYSLIRDFYRDQLSIFIPDFDREFEWWLKGQNLYLENFRIAGFKEVPLAEVKPNDVLLMQVCSPVINHGAIYLGNDKMLHHLHRRLSCRDVWGGYYRKHTVKVVRHESL